MPLLKRKPFSPKKTPPDLKPEEEVFVCRHTHEVFRDYGSFFERTILCNSLLWSCKFTGKSGLTYQEAHQSEKTIVKQAKSLPEPIQRAVLTVVHHTQRGRLANLCDEVFSYLKDRYQEGEEVEIHYPSRRKRGVITRVIPPEEGTSPSCRPTNSSKITDTAILSSPKPRKHSNSEEALHSHTSRKHHGTSERTPSKTRKHSSSSDDRPLSTQVNKQNLDSATAKSPSRKTPKKSFDEDTPSKSKARKHSVESSSEKSTPRKRSSSNGKDTPSKTSSGDKIVKKASVSSSKKGSEEKLVSPSKKTPSHGSTLESPKSKKSTSHGSTLESPKSKKSPLHDNTLESPKSKKSPSHGSTLELPKSKKSPLHDNTLESPKSKKSASHDNTLESPKSKKTLNMSERKSAESDVIVIDDMDNEGNSSVTSPKLSSPKEKPVYTWPDASLYKYEVRLVSERRDKGLKKKEKHCEVVVVHASIVSRRKGVFTRDKLKMLLKISCERSTPQSGDGFYIVQKDYRKIFDLGDPDVPLKLASPPKDKKGRKRSLSHGGAHGEEGGPVKKRRRKKEEQSKNDKEGTRKRKDKKDKDGKHEKKSKLTPEERKRIMEEEKEKRKKGIEEEKERRKVEREKEKAENKVKREEERAVKKLERDKERERLREEKRLEAIRLKEWSKPREDLELDDLMELPKTTPVTLKLSSELFGDMMMVLEFLNIFGGIFDIKDEFPSGLSFGMLEEALTEHDAEGVYYDLLLFLLGAILRTHLEEEEEEGLDGSPDPEPVMDLDDDNDAKGATVSASAIMAAAWPMQHQGKRLHELIMDPFTSSELLRLHLLSSGARIGCGESSYRWQRRGGFTYNDDAGVEFRHAEPHLLKTLVTGNVYDMGPEDKLKIVMALCTQLMTYATARDYVEEGFDRCRKVRREWQEDQWADQRKGKEEAAARYRRKQEERQRQKEELERRKKEKDQERVDGARGESSLKPEDPAEQIPAEDPAQKESKLNPAEAKKGGKKKNTNAKESSQEDETKERPKPSGQVNGSKTPEEKEGDSTPFPVLSKEEEEELAQQRREERRRKDHEFSDLLTKAWSRSGLQPLGRDRVFRRYWSFKSLRGLFVEDDDCGQHLLLQPDPDTEPEDEDEMSVEEQKEEDEEIDKEKADTTAEESNTIDLTMDQEQATPLVNGHTSIKTVKKNRASLEREIVNMFRAYHLTRDVSDNGKICEVYKTRQVVKWSYFCSKEDLDELLDALNSRGCREKLLKEAIQQDYGRLVTAIEKCPLKLEVQAQKKDTKAKGRRGGRNQQAVDKSRYKTMEEFIEANLRDQILDLEERIWQGNLGAIKIDDREAWRAKVENGIYSQFCQPEKEASDGLTTPRDVNGVEENVTPGLLANGSVESMDVDNCVVEDGELRLDTELTSGDTKGDDQMDGEVDQEAAVNGDADESKEELDAVSEELATVEEDRKEDELSFTAVPSYLKLESRPSSPDTRTSTPTLSLVVSHLLVNPAVKELALDLLKVEQGIEQKYLNPPLGEDEETKRQRQREAAAAAVNEFNEMMKVAEVKEKQKKEKKKKESAAANDDNTAETKQSEEEKNGEEGDQISDNSTSSSEEPAKQKTRLERWEESLLSCTNLSQVFVHLNTLDQSIAWGKSVLNARCRLCRRKGDAEHMLLCDACDRGHHMYCLKPPIKEVPEGQWFCADCRPKETRRSERRKKPQLQEEEDDDDDKQEKEEEESSAEEEEEASDEDQGEESESQSESDEDEEQTGESSENSQHGDQCALCTEGGELLCCDTCPLAYHLSCAYPSLRRIPRGNWACQVCTGADEERSRSCRVKKSTIDAAQKSIQRTIKVVKKKTPRASPRPGSRQEKKAPARSRKRKVSSSPSPPPRKADPKADKKSKRQRVSSSSSRSSSPAPRPTRRGSAKGVARGRGRSSIDSSRSSSPALRSESKKQASKGRPKLAAGRLVLCRKLLDELMKHDDAWPFLEAVDLAENPDYIKYVKEPMDLGTIKENLSDKAYDSVEDFATHVRQVFINCSEYCRPRAKEARAGVRLSALFETKYSEMGLDATETRATRSRRT